MYSKKPFIYCARQNKRAPHFTKILNKQDNLHKFKKHTDTKTQKQSKVKHIRSIINHLDSYSSKDYVKFLCLPCHVKKKKWRSHDMQMNKVLRIMENIHKNRSKTLMSNTSCTCP